VFKVIEERRMINREFASNHNDELAERCRKALEKECGFDIPMPKSSLKKHFWKGKTR